MPVPEPVYDEGVYVADADGRFLHVDEPARHLLGYESLDELRGRDAHATIHHTRCSGEPYPVGECPLTAVARTERSFASESDCFFRRDGLLLPVAYTAMPVPVDGRTGTAVLFRPRSARADVVAKGQEAERRLRQSDRLHRTLLANLPDTTIFLLDQDLRILYAGGEGARAFEWFDEGLFIGRKVSELVVVPPDLRALAEERYRGALNGERTFYEGRTGPVTFHVQSVPLYAEDGSVESALVVARDVSASADAQRAEARRARQQQAVAELGRFALEIREHAPLVDRALETAMEVLDADGGAVLEMTSPDAAVVRAVSGLEIGVRPGDTGPLDPETTAAGCAIRTGEPLDVDDYEHDTRFTPSPEYVRAGLRSSIMVPIFIAGTAYGVISVTAREPGSFTEDDAAFLSTIGTIVGVAVERRRDEEAAHHAALHDQLTGLPNRALALDRLEQALARRSRDACDIAVLTLDIDLFKHINDSFGHAAGDEVLVELARRLCALIRPADTLARMGGDEFVVICPDADITTAGRVAERLAAVARRPMSLRHGEHFFTVSTGIALARETSDSAESLLSDADAAMYRAKELGRDRFEVFDAEMRSGVMARLRTERELRTALDRDELVAWYQPVIDLESGRVIATEALVRWQHPEQGLVPPFRFIPVAEESGLISELGLRVLEQACAQTARWQREGTPLSVSVNVSGRQVVNPSFPEQVAAIARDAGLAPGTLALEITETVLMEEAERPIAVLHDLRDLGFRLFLDDFGTGYSSLARLRSFPLDAVKIDRAFIAGVATEPNAASIVRAIVDMAHALGHTVVAEGVETSEQEDVLRQLGCDHVQGYLHSPPRPADELAVLLAHAAR